MTAFHEGRATGVENYVRKDRFDDPLVTCSTADEEGFVQSRGWALLRCQQGARGLSSLSVEIESGLNVVPRA